MAVTPAPYTGTATGAKRALGWYSDSEINAPTTPAATNQTPQAVTATKPMVGPLTTGQTRPNVANPTPTVAPKTPDVQNGRMPGPFIAPDGGVQQGANVVGGKIQYDQPTPKVATSDSGVPQSGLYQDQYARTPQQIADLARERIQKILQAGQTAATGALTGAKDAYDYTQKTTLGNRSLLQFDNSQRGDQFGGSAREDKFRLDRQQGIEDTATTNQYQANVAQINQKLADLQAAAPGDEAAIVDQLQQIERTTGISVAQLQEQQKQNQLGQSNADRTFNYNAGQDQIQNNRNASNDAYNQSLETAKYGLDVQKQHVDLANKLTELFGVKVNPTSDPMQAYAQVAGLSTTAAQKIAADAKQSTFDNAIKLALANNTITQTQASILNQANQLGISQQNANTASANSANSNENMKQDNLINVWKAKGKAPAGITGVPEGTPYAGDKPTEVPKLQTAETYASYIDGMAKYATNEKTGAKSLSNAVDVETSILQSNLSEPEMKKLYTRYGLKWGG